MWLIILFHYFYFPKDCKYPAQPANGVVKLTVDLLTTYGASALVTCNTGYKIRGDGLLLCKADGLWSTLPSCIIKGNVNQEHSVYKQYELDVNCAPTWSFNSSTMISYHHYHCQKMLVFDVKYIFFYKMS